MRTSWRGKLWSINELEVRQLTDKGVTATCASWHKRIKKFVTVNSRYERTSEISLWLPELREPQLPHKLITLTDTTHWVANFRRLGVVTVPDSRKSQRWVRFDKIVRPCYLRAGWAGRAQPTCAVRASRAARGKQHAGELCGVGAKPTNWGSWSMRWRVMTASGCASPVLQERAWAWARNRWLSI